MLGAAVVIQLVVWFCFRPGAPTAPPRESSGKGGESHAIVQSDPPVASVATDTGSASSSPAEASTAPAATSPDAGASGDSRTEPIAPTPVTDVPSTPLPAGSRGLRVAVVDMQRLFDAHPDTQDTADAINAKRLTYKEELERLTESGDTEAAASYRETHEKELQDDARRRREKILADLRQRITAAALQRGFDLVMDSSGKTLNDVPVILHAPALSDITDDLIRELTSPGARENH